MKVAPWLGIAVLLGSGTAAPTARADESTPPPSAPSPKRSLPDYNGPADPTTPGDVALWVPRVVFFPLYVTSEFVIRRPLGALLTAAERANIPTVLYDFFAFGPDHKAGVAPIAFLDFGFQPSVGLYAFWDDALFKGDDLRLHASTGGSDWLAGSVVQRLRFHDKDSVELRLLAVHRPDSVYYGQGPGTLQSSQSRYGEDRIDGRVGAQFRLWRASVVEAELGGRSVHFYDGSYGGDPTVLQQVVARVFPTPDGYLGGYVAEYNGIRAALDSRRPYPESGSGFRVEAQAQQGNSVDRAPASGWLKYQGALGGFLDITHRRVVSLSVTTAFSDPLGSSPVPFTELASVGGDLATAGIIPMPGFFPGRLVDRSATTATLHYRWPIGPWLDGSMQLGVGNVFGAHLNDFDPKLLRLSAALGIETDASPDGNFQFVVGMGTETFEHGTQVDSFRLAFGISRF